ncbi:MerR family transcriptional regulator [Pacificibacter maritimus]|uniref:MerR family transcriptional regulator n=1 Tax=Pacificibacter maritimus TaxID=762213 RepID=A0A3N4U7A1_9RHOB|nr:MerR family DNA-binding transcriptional regulator [Pacificibacter maritimus]RPE66322.1 MerR family transcriptional regulator [Pacificibacter maritimus]
MPNTRLTFKEMCATFDVTPRTLRYYEYIELLTPEKVGRTRFYSGREVARMKLVMRGRKFGFSLEDIRRFLSIYDEKGQMVQAKAFIELADRQLDTLTQQRADLDEAIAELTQLRDDMAAL